MLRFSGAGVSDVGRVRPHNEDSGFVGPYVALVADGVGGAAAGEIASATAAYSASAVALAQLGERPELVLAVAYLAANAALARRGARHRKRSGDEQPSEDEQQGSGAAIAVGALLDGSRSRWCSASGCWRAGR